MSVHPSICSPACLFSSPSIHQPVHWFIVNPCPCFLPVCPSLLLLIHSQTMVHLHFSPTISYILAPVHSLIYPLIHALSVFCQSFCMYVTIKLSGGERRVLHRSVANFADTPRNIAIPPLPLQCDVRLSIFLSFSQLCIC